MKEASKTRRARSQSFYETYMSGKVLDIGCGDDLCVPHATPFDKEHGDANEIRKYLPSETFDCVHSSHCLEHMFDAPTCLRNWWSLVKPGGHLIIMVPDEDLYEQGNWPSLFNEDHKCTFRLSGKTSWSPVSHSLTELIETLPNAEIVSATRMDNYYVYGTPLKSKIGRYLAITAFRILRFRMGVSDTANTKLGRMVLRLGLAGGRTMDQTMGSALAQLEVIARKRICD